MREGTAWAEGRFDRRTGPRRVLFGRMYEDPSVEAGAFAPGGRVFCIASAGDTARALSARHDEVVAVDINPVQLEYARERLAGAPAVEGSAERVMGALRRLLPLAGLPRRELEAFLAMDDPAAQIRVWRERLCTRRFRFGLDALLSVTGLRAVYDSPFLAILPRHFGRVLLGRMERAFARFPNRDNPWLHALLLGAGAPDSTPPGPGRIDLVCGDAATVLEERAPASFHAFTISNIVDGASEAYRARLAAAIRRAAAPDAMLVWRSFGDPQEKPTTADHAGDDRSAIWGIVRVGRADQSLH